eukprot:scaffold28.g7551.t1
MEQRGTAAPPQAQHPGRAGPARAAAEREVRQLEAEKAADEEYSHMSKAQKTFLRAKEWLFEWLATGVEPL